MDADVTGEEYLSQFTFDMDADTPPAYEPIDIAYCIRFGDMTKLTILLNTDRGLVSKDLNGWGKPHMYATKEGKLSIVKLLVDNGADVNATESCGQSALYFAIWYDHFDVFEYLLSKGANVNQRDSFNSTPLIQAAYYRRRKMLQCLIKQGAEINAQDNCKFDVVDHFRDTSNLPSSYYRNIYISDSSSRKKNVLDLVGPLGSNALNFEECHNLGILDIKDLIHHGDTTSLSLAIGIPELDVLNTDIDCYSKPIIYAAREGNISIVKLLVQNGADMNVTDAGGNSALYYAIWHDHYDVVFYLVSNGANLKQCDIDNSTPLIEAAKYKRKRMIELFIKHDCDICATTKSRGMNAIDFAKREGYRDIVTLLEKEIGHRGLQNTGKYGDISVDEAMKRGKFEYNPNYLVVCSPQEDTDYADLPDYEYSGFSGSDGSSYDQGIPGLTQKDLDAVCWFPSSSSDDDEEYGIHRGPKEKRYHKPNP